MGKSVILLMSIFIFVGCRTIEYVPVEKIVTKDSVIVKTEYVNKETKVKEYVAGDTVYHDSIVFCTILRCDTIYSHSVDSIPYPVEVVKEVKAPRSWYEKTMIRLGWVLIGLIVAVVGWKVVKLYGKIRV